MKRLFKENWRLIFLWAFSNLIIAILFICFGKDQRVGPGVMAFSTITLVFITWFYAKQTERLVEEQRNTLKETTEKRKIDFTERKLHEFYAPATFALAAISLEFESAHIEGLKNSFCRLMDLYSRFSYFASKEIRDIIREFIDKFKPYIDKGDLDKLRKGFPPIVDKLGLFLQAEYLILENKITDFYK
jgi:hypothetical protein